MKSNNLKFSSPWATTLAEWLGLIEGIGNKDRKHYPIPAGRTCASRIVFGSGSGRFAAEQERKICLLCANNWADGTFQFLEYKVSFEKIGRRGIRRRRGIWRGEVLNKSVGFKWS